MAQRKQFMAMVDEPTFYRLDALRIVMGVSRAEVNRQALEGKGIGALERENGARLDRLQRLADSAGISLVKYVQWFAETYRQGGPTLEGLEEADSGHLASLTS